MSNLFAVYRYLVFAVHIACNIGISVVASLILYIALAFKDSSIIEINALLIALAGMGLLFAFTILVLDALRRKSVVRHIWFECVWVGIFCLLLFASAAVTTLTMSDFECAADNPLAIIAFGPMRECVIDTGRTNASALHAALQHAVPLAMNGTNATNVHAILAHALPPATGNPNSTAAHAVLQHLFSLAAGQSNATSALAALQNSLPPTTGTANATDVHAILHRLLPLAAGGANSTAAHAVLRHLLPAVTGQTNATGIPEVQYSPPLSTNGTNTTLVHEALNHLLPLATGQSNSTGIHAALLHLLPPATGGENTTSAPAVFQQLPSSAPEGSNTTMLHAVLHHLLPLATGQGNTSSVHALLQHALPLATGHSNANATSTHAITQPSLPTIVAGPHSLLHARYVVSEYLRGRSGSAPKTTSVPTQPCMYPVSVTGPCVLSALMLAFTWAAAANLLIYLLVLTVLALLHKREETHVWTAPASQYPWFAPPRPPPGKEPPSRLLLVQSQLRSGRLVYKAGRLALADPEKQAPGSALLTPATPFPRPSGGGSPRSPFSPRQLMLSTSVSLSPRTAAAASLRTHASPKRTRDPQKRVSKLHRPPSLDLSRVSRSY